MRILKRIIRFPLTLFIGVVGTLMVLIILALVLFVVFLACVVGVPVLVRQVMKEGWI